MQEKTLALKSSCFWFAQGIKLLLNELFCERCLQKSIEMSFSKSPQTHLILLIWVNLCDWNVWRSKKRFTCTLEHWTAATIKIEILQVIVLSLYITGCGVHWNMSPIAIASKFQMKNNHVIEQNQWNQLIRFRVILSSLANIKLVCLLWNHLLGQLNSHLMIFLFNLLWGKHAGKMTFIGTGQSNLLCD